jgi:hypothetical protein
MGGRHLDDDSRPTRQPACCGCIRRRRTAARQLRAGVARLHTLHETIKVLVVWTESNQAEMAAARARYDARRVEG